jgi:enoyl-CoA hydratase
LSFQNITVEERGNVSLIKVCRPQAANALSIEAIEEIRLAIDTSKSFVLIFTGEGEKNFISGRDIRDLPKLSKYDAINHRLSDLLLYLESMERCSIAAVNGYALGGGFEFALACDIRVASENAVFGLPETKLGIIPGAGGIGRLSRIAGLSITKEMILTGTTMSAKRALELGIVCNVTTQSQLIETALSLANKVTERGPLAIKLAKMVANSSRDLHFDAGTLYERLAQAVCFQSNDKLEGVNAFLERRKPNFTGS